MLQKLQSKYHLSDMFAPIFSNLTETPVNGSTHAYGRQYYFNVSLNESNLETIGIEFEGVNTLLLSRLLGVDPMAASLDWIGMPVRPRFLRNSKLKPTDIYFVPRESDE